jgi:hypothetical protein
MLETKKQPSETTVKTEIPKCGIVMPISAIEGLPAEHWEDVLNILTDVISSINFEANLVSNADEVGIIQKRIIQNLYNNDIIVCDVSCKNPNVMFELGMRLAFDKPTIIIKDDKTDYSFDTSPIEHLSYPRDLRFTKIMEFKEKLKTKIEGTYQKWKSDTNYSTFLKSFGQFKIAQLEEKEVSSHEFLIDSLKEIIASEISKIRFENVYVRSNSNQSEANGIFDSAIKSALVLYAKQAKKEYVDLGGPDFPDFVEFWKENRNILPVSVRPEQVAKHLSKLAIEKKEMA